MNKNRFIALLLLVTCIFSSCEKDDLCIPAELDIPRLVVVFVDARNQLVRKPVASLQVFETGDNTAVPLNTDGATTLTAVDSIAIPLRIDQDNTSFAFTRSLNGSDNSDGITFEYEPDEVYLNRACGFKAIYNNLTFTRPQENPENPWITRVTIRTTDVTSNNDIHVEIQH